MSEKSNENATKSDNNFTPTFVDHHSLPSINLNGPCLIKNISFQNKLVNLYISYTLVPELRNKKTDFR